MGKDAGCQDYNLRLISGAQFPQVDLLAPTYACGAHLPTHTHKHTINRKSIFGNSFYSESKTNTLLVDHEVSPKSSFVEGLVLV